MILASRDGESAGGGGLWVALKESSTGQTWGYHRGYSERKC